MSDDAQRATRPRSPDPADPPPSALPTDAVPALPTDAVPALPTDAVAVLGEQMIRMARLTHALKAQTAEWLPEGLEWAAFGLMAHLVVGGPRRQRELARCSLLDPSTISRHVAQLVGIGLAERRPDPADGRAALLAVTPEGTALFDAVGRRRTRAITDFVSGWDPEDVSRLATLLTRFCDAIQDHHAEHHIPRTAPRGGTPPQQTPCEGHPTRTTVHREIQ